MFRNVADCLETLEDAGSRFYTITGPGVSLQYNPEDEGAATVENCLARFQRDFDKLGPGRYTTAHKKSATDTRSKAAFSFFKIAEGAAVGNAAAADGFLLADMQLKMQQLQHDIDIKLLKRDHADEIKQLKAKDNQVSGLDKVSHIFSQIAQLQQHQNALPAVAGPPTQTASTVPVEVQSQVINEVVEALHVALGESDERTVDVLRKIANVARTNPAQILTIVNFL